MSNSNPNQMVECDIRAISDPVLCETLESQYLSVRHKKGFPARVIGGVDAMRLERSAFCV